MTKHVVLPGDPKPSGTKSLSDHKDWAGVTPPAPTITEHSTPTFTGIGVAPGQACNKSSCLPAVWFTEYAAAKIGRITTAGNLQDFALPNPNSYPLAIAAGSDGALWFTEYPSQIGRMTAAGVLTKEYPTPTTGYPTSIAAGSDGALWFTESQASNIGRITTGGKVTEYSVSSGPWAITAGPDGALWFTAYRAIGRITTKGKVSEFSVSAAYGITSGPDGALWFTENTFATNKIGRMTTAGVLTNEYTIPTPNSGPEFITTGPDGALWFTEVDANQIGRITTAGVITEYLTARESHVVSRHPNRIRTAISRYLS